MQRTSGAMSTPAHTARHRAVPADSPATRLNRRVGLAVAATLGATVVPAAAASAAPAAAHTVQPAKAVRHASPHHASVTLAVQPLTYQIRPGDTLIGIAKRHNTTVDALRKANGIAGHRIIAGSNLTVPGRGHAVAPKTSTSPAKASSRATSGVGYLVKRGDTLGALARHHGVTVEQIKTANPQISGNRIMAGKRIVIPGQTAAAPAKATKSGTSRAGKPAAQPSSSRSASSKAYTVRAGDTLSGIAKRFKTTTAAIKAANPGLNGSRIYAGKAIAVPSAAPAQAKSSAPKVGTTFAGRTYKPEVTSAAQANKDKLHNRKVPSRKAMQSMVARTAAKHGVDPQLAQAVSYQESGFNMRAVSPANAVGVMQVIPSSVDWASSMAGRKLNGLDPQDNVTAGVLVLKANLTAADGKEDYALAGYYQGMRSVKNNGMYEDTKAYVASIKALKKRF